MYVHIARATACFQGTSLVDSLAVCSRYYSGSFGEDVARVKAATAVHEVMYWVCRCAYTAGEIERGQARVKEAQEKLRERIAQAAEQAGQLEEARQDAHSRCVRSPCPKPSELHPRS